MKGLKLFFFLSIFFMTVGSSAAQQDSSGKKNEQKKISEQVLDTSSYSSILSIDQLPIGKTPIFLLNEEHTPINKDILFYLLAGIAVFFGFIKTTFPAYLKNIFSGFFRTSFTQKQTWEQWTTATLPALFMNLLFVASLSIYIALVLTDKNKVQVNFALLCFYCATALTVLYVGKYLLLKFLGWIFDVSEAAARYIFVVFLVNKIIGIVILPLLLILAFSSFKSVNTATIASFYILGTMIVYRYAIGFGAVRHVLRISAFHFFLYLCAGEILPLLLIYKTLAGYIETNI
jgi:hypothetical protein